MPPETAERVTVHVQLELRDLLRLAFRTALSRRTLLLHGLVLSGMALAMLLNLTGVIPGPGIGTWSVLFAVYLATFLLALPLHAYTATRIEWLRGRATYQDLQYTLTPEGVEVQSVAARAHIAWDLFDRAVETRGAILLFLTGRQALVIPTRAFEAPGDLEAARGVLRRALGDRAELRDGPGPATS